MLERRNSKAVGIGNLFIGGNHRISIQSMTNTKTSNIKATVEQINALTKAGCDIVRVTVNDQEAAEAIKEIKKEISIPIIGDIHFDYKLALEAAKNGIDKIRINPGNIGVKERAEKVFNSCNEKNIPIRIGVNSGSLPKDIVKKNNGVTADGMVEALFRYVDIARESNFENIVLSLKASDVNLMIEANRLVAQRCDYPIHLGVTEAGTFMKGAIKSAMGIGALLEQGIGDTFRVSLTGDVINEIFVAKEILRNLRIIDDGINIISCPTCGRTDINLENIVDQVEKKILDIQPKKRIDVAIMGCIVNGPGEAKEADLGLAGGKNEALLFKKGKVLKKVPEDKAVDSLVELIKEIAE